VETVPILGRNAFDVLYLAALSKGMIEQSDLTSIFAAQMQKKLTPEEIRQFIAMLKKYPEPYQLCADYAKQAHKNLRELSSLL
jgi:succinate dehydrogenase flavin-adding protein (antitoxin of CptAB toxin-antitoxin module)